MSTQHPTFIALLRAINVGGKNKLPMKELAAMFVANGCSEVKTYIQSGNVIFRASPEIAAKAPSEISKNIQTRFGFYTPIITRTAEELTEASRKNPFLTRGIEASLLHLMFLSEAPLAERLASLDPNRSSPDEFVVSGRDVYLFLPNGVGKTKLSNDYFEKRLSVSSTVRNWRTVLELVSLSRSE